MSSVKKEKKNTHTVNVITDISFGSGRQHRPNGDVPRSRTNSDTIHDAMLGNDKSHDDIIMHILKSQWAQVMM